MCVCVCIHIMCTHIYVYAWYLYLVLSTELTGQLDDVSIKEMSLASNIKIDDFHVFNCVDLNYPFNRIFFNFWDYLFFNSVEI